MYVKVPDGADSLLSLLQHYMQEWTKEEKDAATSNGDVDQQNQIKDGEPASQFEFHALEALLRTLKEWETVQYNAVNKTINQTLAYFKMGSLIPVEIQEKMRMLKNELSLLMNRVSASRRVIQELTEDDEEMALMNLTVLRNKPTLYRLPLTMEILTLHDRTEELLENYLIDFTSLETKIVLTKSQIQNAEESVSLRLDTSRNELLIANTALAVLACSIAFGAYITGVFGMNLDQTIYLMPQPNSFVIVCTLSFAVIPIIFVVIYGYFSAAGILPVRIGNNAYSDMSPKRHHSALKTQKTK